MGRVYEALRRAAETNGANNNNGKRSVNGEGARGAGSNGSASAQAGEVTAAAARPHPAPAAATPAVPEHLLGRGAAHFNAPDSARETAPNERTGWPVGSALPDGRTSRVAGATLGAAGSARVAEFPTVEISAARVEPHIIAVTQPNSPHAERFRSLRTRVLHAGESKQLQALVVTSAGVMEGKTMTAVNLSLLLAQTDGVRALLIDGDLRNPCVADYLGLDAPAGLSDVLAGNAALEDSIVRLEPSGLCFLPGGEARDDVAEILSGPRFSEVVKRARTMFDYIIIDAPPLGIFTDAAVLINRADSALIVARAGRTRYTALERLLEPIPRKSILGVVLNGADEPAGQSYDYYYRRRYARRGEEARAASKEAAGEVVIEE
jgi:capsular exopolysaccharide synthesis family protein